MARPKVNNFLHISVSQISVNGDVDEKENDNLLNTSVDLDEEIIISDDCLSISNQESSSEKSISSLELQMRKLKLFKYFITRFFKSKL